jgi:glycosyltransferase involved in cell wall biosynthesis
MAPQKGVGLLIGALSDLAGEGVQLEVDIVGSGPEEQSLRRMAEQLGIASRLTFHGSLSGLDVRNIIDQCQFMILPSFAEGLPVVLMEAYARGRPALSTFIAGIPELVVPGESGWMVPAGDVNALKVALRDASSTSSEKLKQMGEAGRRAVAERHNAEVEGKRLISFLKQASEANVRD